MRTSFLTILLVLTAITCHGQSFLSKYPELNQNNLKEFFSDWKAYSDRIASIVKNKDNLLEGIVGAEYQSRHEDDQANESCRYIVVPQYIKVERYRQDIDTTGKYSFDSFFYQYPRLKEKNYSLDTITLRLPEGGLYLTTDIRNLLSQFLGGIPQTETGTMSEINKHRVKELRKYIPVYYGHWGGYWWFTTFPLITKIFYANNLIAVMRRTGWYCGDEIWYLKEKGKFVKLPEPKCSWIE